MYLYASADDRWKPIPASHCLQCESENYPLKLFAIFLFRLSIFPWNFANLLPIYIHTHTYKFCWFILIFSKMASIFQGIFHRFFQVSIFIKSTCRDSTANDKWPQFTRPQSTELSGLEAMLESYHKLQSKPKTVPEFKDALQLTWFSLYRRKPLTTLR